MALRLARILGFVEVPVIVRGMPLLVLMGIFDAKLPKLPIRVLTAVLAWLDRKSVV